MKRADEADEWSVVDKGGKADEDKGDTSYAEDWEWVDQILIGEVWPLRKKELDHPFNNHWLTMAAGTLLDSDTGSGSAVYLLNPPALSESLLRCVVMIEIRK